MIRAVVDANVFASGVLAYRRPESKPGAIFRLWRDRAFVLVASDHIIEEAERTLPDLFFASRIPPGERKEALEALTVIISGVASHAEDDLVLAAAVSANAGCLVTGDKQLQRLGSFEGIEVVAPRDFLVRFDEEDQRVSR